MTLDPPQQINPNTSLPPRKQPKLILSEEAGDRPVSLFSFSPNRETLGGTAYLIVGESNILVDCPAWDDTTQSFLQEKGGVDWLFLTHRDAIAHVREIQQTFNCKIAIQEQEAYLLPKLAITPFQRELTLTPANQVLWTSGHTPGSACLYSQHFGGVLFSGRHLLPNPQGQLVPIKTAKTFHWRRQLQSVQHLRQEFTPDTLQFICPGANLGFLRGKTVVEQAYQRLMLIDIEHAIKMV